MSLLSRLLSRKTLLADRFLYATPASLGLEAEEVEFPAGGGLKLRGWLCPGEKAGVVVFCPGNSANVSCHLEYVRLARMAGFSVLAFDYRGFGRSDGEPDLRSLPLDVEAAGNFASLRLRGEPIGLFGVSLGAGAALAAAARRGRGISAVAVEGVSDIGEMLEGYFRWGAFGPVRAGAGGGGNGNDPPRPRARLGRGGLPRPLSRWMACVLESLYPFEGRSPRRLVPRLHPGLAVFVIHGVEDQLLPFEAAVDLHGALCGPKRLWLIEGVGHAQEAVLGCGKEYVRQLGDFFTGAFPRSAPPRDKPDLLDPEEHEVTRARYDAGGYRAAFRELVEAINRRDLSRLDASLGDYMKLERAYPFDFFAAVYCLRAAHAALGLASGWRSRDGAAARRSLERFLALWASHPALPGPEVPASPAAWARSQLERA